MRAPTDSGQVFAAWRAPFSDGIPEWRALPAGSTLGDLVKIMPGLPIDFERRGAVAIGGHVIEREHWTRVRPKPGQRVTFHYALQGGGGGQGGGGRKSGILGIVVAVAAIALSVATLGGGLAFLGGASGLFTGGTLSAKLLATGISLAGSLASAALSAPPTPQRNKGGVADETRGPASASGNLLGPGAPVPAVLGERRIFPPLAHQPLVERVGDDEFVEASFILDGPHALTDIRIGDASIADAEDVDYQVRNGWDDDEAIDLIGRYGVTKTPSAELAAQNVSAGNQQVVDNQTTPSSSMPQWSSLAISADADEFWIHLTFPEGLAETDDAAAGPQTVPFRLRMRQAGTTTWKNLPELHFTAKENRELRAEIRLVWGVSPPETVSAVPTTSGWSAGYKVTPGQSGAVPTSDFFSDPSFWGPGAGFGLYSGAESADNLRRVNLGDRRATLYMDPAAFPKGARYELQIKRGLTFRSSNFSRSGYSLSTNLATPNPGNIHDLFWYVLSGTNGAVIARSRDNLADRVYAVRASSVWRSHPIAGGAGGSGLAIIAVKAKNRQLENLSVKAAAYMKDWDGAGWNSWTTSRNPAVQFHEVLRGARSPDPLPADLLDTASLVAWRQHCIAKGYTCDLICEGDGLAEVLTKIAGCGYARPRASETWGVIMDRDRSADDPVQIFTPRNSSGLTMTKAFARLPDAFRVSYAEAANDDADEELIVFRPGQEDVLDPRIEQIRYEGISSEAAAEARAVFDLSQGELRSTFWEFSAPAEAIRVTRGDLIAVNHDVLERTHGSGRIVDVEIANGAVAAIVLDAEVPVYAEGDMLSVANMLAVGDMLTIGATTAVSIRRSDGLTSQHLVSAPSGSRQRLALATPAAVVLDDDDAPTIREECLAWVGQPGAVALRLLVTGIEFDAQLQARITAVDEAPQLWN